MNSIRTYNINCLLNNYYLLRITYYYIIYLFSFELEKRFQIVEKLSIYIKLWQK